MVAGAIPGRTRTLAVGIYTLVETGREETAWSLLLVSALLAFGAIYVSNRLVEQKAARDRSVDRRHDAPGRVHLIVRDAASVEVLGLFGPSGSGKTSLLEAIAGIRRPDAGEIRIGDRILFSSASRNRPAGAGRRMATCPQDSLLFPIST
jgi:ABC-type glutathione transport system ATPase component